MADMISPGVYTNIIDLSTYLTSTSGTIGFVPILAEKGEDNVLVRLTSYQEYMEKFGEPDMRIFGKYYGCGPYIAAQHMSVSSDLYVIRALPDDATYAHAFIYFRSIPDFPEQYRFDEKFEISGGSIRNYDGSHISLGCFSVQAGLEYSDPSGITVTWDEITPEHDEYNKTTDTDPVLGTTYYVEDGDSYSEAVLEDKYIFNGVDKIATPDPVEGTQYYKIEAGEYVPVSVTAWEDNVDYFTRTTSGKKFADGVDYFEKTTVPGRTETKTTDKTFTLNPQWALQAVTAKKAFKLDGTLATDASATGEDKPVITTDENYAKKSKAPKMNNTQMLDALFYGNDPLIQKCVEVACDEKGQSSDLYTEKDPHKCVLAYVRAIGRGDFYNSMAIKVTSDANPASFGMYKFQIFELQDGVDTLCESYNVSFDPEALDNDGETCYFADVINKYSSRIRVEANPEALPIISKQLKGFYLNDPTIKDITSDFTEEEYDAYGKITKGFPAVPTYNADENTIENADGYATLTTVGYKARAIWYAYLDQAYADRQDALATAQYEAALALDDEDDSKEDAIQDAIDALDLAEDMQKAATESLEWASALNLLNMADSDPVTSGDQPFYLENGSLGSLLRKNGTVQPKIGNQILAKAYTGLLKNPVIVKKVDESTGNIKYSQQYTDNVYDLDWIYFTIVYDPGYKPDVKAAALNLVDTYRRDCVLISDCGDNSTYEECLKYVGAVKGGDAHPWNTYLAARYEPYSRVYDVYTGKDIWVSPVYHMAKLLPQTDKLYNVWYAPAGFTRGTVSDIKELRYSCNKAQRDLMYMAQVNPIVHFPEGMIVWGQLTTQKKNSTLSDLNCVRCVLYIKRALEQYCKNFIFEHNDATTWASIKSGISPFLETVKANRGLKSYSISVGATEYEYKTKVCHVNVMLEPLKVLEKIQLNMYIQ